MFSLSLTHPLVEKKESEAEQNSTLKAMMAVEELVANRRAVNLSGIDLDAIILGEFCFKSEVSWHVTDIQIHLCEQRDKDK
jgi:hypothetical protein